MNKNNSYYSITVYTFYSNCSSYSFKNFEKKKETNAKFVTNLRCATYSTLNDRNSRNEQSELSPNKK
jgi:hypothetical protein